MRKLFTFFVLVILAFDTLAIGPEVNPFLPQTERASEDDTEQCVRPECAYSITGFTEARVMITNNEEGATVIFDVYRDDKQIWKGSFKGEELTFDVEGEGNYVVHAIATKSGKYDSPDGGVFFLIWNGVTPPTGISEIAGGKTIASQEIHQSERPGEDNNNQCQRPQVGYCITDFTTASVAIRNLEEGATVIFDVYRDDNRIWKGSFKGEELTFDVEGEGNYVVHAIATKSGKSDSPDGGIFFLIWNGDDAVSELVNGKTVASVRYFNVAGQEMPEANGMTIVVTTYTDGSTSTAKVVK